MSSKIRGDSMTTPQPKKLFSIEKRRMERLGQIPGTTIAVASPADANVSNAQVLAAIADLKTSILAEVRQIIAAGVPVAGVLPGASLPEPDFSNFRMAEDIPATLQARMDDAYLVKNEIRALSFSIQETKREIAALYKAQGDKNRLEVVTHELDTIVRDTERATQSIMDLAERIDDAAQNIVSTADNSYVASVAEEISNTAVKMFEACNFQDLTGQRITKVVNTLKLIEDRLMKIINIWGEEDFMEMEVPEDPTGLDGLQKVLDRPTDENEKVTQDKADQLMDQNDLDALFG